MTCLAQTPRYPWSIDQVHLHNNLKSLASERLLLHQHHTPRLPSTRLRCYFLLCHTLPCGGAEVSSHQTDLAAPARLGSRLLHAVEGIPQRLGSVTVLISRARHIHHPGETQHILVLHDTCHERHSEPWNVPLRL